MTIQEIAVQVLYPLALAVGVPLVIRWRNRLNVYSRRKRQEDLAEMAKPEYCQKKQRKMFIQFGVAIYFIGAYLAFASIAGPGFSLARAMFGVVVAITGAIAGANAKTINEYGLNQQKEEYAKIEGRKTRSREFDDPN